MKTRPVYIAGSIRTPFVKSLTHYKDLSTQELMTIALEALIKKMHLSGKVLGDVSLGALMNHSANWNLARECVLGTSLDPHTPAYTLQRACGTSLEATWNIALKIAHHQIDNGIAAGVDSNSDMPIEIQKSLAKKLIALKQAKNFKEKIKIFASLRPSDFKPVFPTVSEPRTGLSMGEHCEKMVQEWGITREAQDELSRMSHEQGGDAYERGFYEDLVFEVQGIKKDSIIRTDTSLQKLAKLKTAFDFTEKGTLTAGNSSPLTDGAAAVFLTCEEYASQFHFPLLAKFVDAEVAAVDFVHGEGLLMAPTIAVSELLKRNHLSLTDFDFY